MKQCTYCGKEYSDGASVCAIDGQPLRYVTSNPQLSHPPPIWVKKQTADREHINLLSIFHFIVAGLSILGIGFLFLHYFMMNSFFSNPGIWRTQQNAFPFPKDFLNTFVWFYISVGVILVIACVLNLLSALFLRQRKHRVFSIVVGGLNCLQIPFGTILGIFTIVILSRDSVREIYAL